MLDFLEIKRQTHSPKPEQHSPLPMYTDTDHCKDQMHSLRCGDEIFLTIPSPTRFLRYPRRNWPDYAATVTAFSCLLIYAGYTEEFFLQRLRTLFAGSDPPPPGLSYIRASPARHLWHYFFHF